MTSAHDLFREPAEFLRGVADMAQLPPGFATEVAFAGRSNVGKSSLLNALLRRKQLARTSKTPGCTQQVNFYKLGNKLLLADVPGYGYARASKKDSAGWNELVRDYLTVSANLRRVFLLIDARHGVMENDEEIMDLLDVTAVSYQVVLTKADKQGAAEIEKILANVQELGVKHTALHPETVITSSVDGIGLDELRGVIARLVK